MRLSIWHWLVAGLLVIALGVVLVALVSGDRDGGGVGPEAYLAEEASSIQEVSRSLPGSIVWIGGGPDLQPGVPKFVDCVWAGNRLIGRLRAPGSFLAQPTVVFRYSSARDEELTGQAERMQNPESLDIEFVGALASADSEDTLRERFPDVPGQEKCWVEITASE